MKYGYRFIFLSIAISFFTLSCAEKLSTQDPSVIQSSISARDNDDDNNNRDIRPTSAPVDCPIGLVNELTLDDEFGPGTADITRCLYRHRNIYSVYPLNRLCTNDSCVKAYGLGNITNAIKDYEITNGLVLHDNYDITAVIYGNGALFAVDNNAAEPFVEQNPFQAEIEALMAKGVHFYLCQNTARGKGIMTKNLIPGIKYVTSGVTAIAEFQLMDYALVMP